MLSCMSDEEVLAVLDASALVRRTPKTIVSRSALMAEIRAARKQGFAIAVEQIYEGEISAAVALTGLVDQRPAAVNVSVPLSRWTERAVKEDLLPVLQTLASSIRR